MPFPAIKDCAFAAIDFESAGALKGETDQPVQIGIVKCGDFHSAPETWMSYIYPDKPVLWAASQVHGITTEMLAEAPAFVSLWPVIKNHLAKTAIIGHNISTERRFLRAFPGHGFGPWVDTLVLAKNCLPGLNDYTLKNVSDHLGITRSVVMLVPGKTWHDALFDAAASWYIFHKIVSELQIFAQPLDCLGASLKK